MVPITTPRRCRATITGLASLSHRGSLALLDIALPSTLALPRMEGAPFRQTAQLSGLDLLYDPAHPSQLGFPQHQLVLRLYEEKAGQVPLLHSGAKTGSHLLVLTFQTPHPLLQKLNSLLGRKRGQKREPGRKLRVLFDRLPQKLAQPGEELLASRAGYLVDPPLGSPPLAYRLPRHNEPLPLQLVLAPLTHQRAHLISVHRPLVEERHHRQSQRIGYLPLRSHQSSFSRYELVEIDYIFGLVWCQASNLKVSGISASQHAMADASASQQLSTSASDTEYAWDYCGVQPEGARLPCSHHDCHSCGACPRESG